MRTFPHTTKTSHHPQDSVEQIVVKPENDVEMIGRLVELRARVNLILAKSLSRPHAAQIVAPSSPRLERAKGKGKAKATERDDEENIVYVVDEQFGYAAQDAFKEGLSSRKNKPAEMLGTSFDEHGCILS